MAFIFTDNQLRTASQEVLDIPQQISILQQQEDQATDGQATALAKDQTNKVYFDNYQNIISKYNDERQQLDGVVITLYSESTLIDSAKQASGNLHYPISPPPWINFPPKLIGSAIGQPSSTVATHEQMRIASAQLTISELTAGFSDGIIDDTLFDVYAGSGMIKVTNGGFVLGQRVVVDNGNVSLYGVITNVYVPPPSFSPGFCTPAGPVDEASCLLALGVWTPGSPIPQEAQQLTITVFAAPLGSLPAGSRVRNYHPGFSNNEREGVTVPYAPEMMEYIEGVLDTRITNWKSHLTAQLTALNDNDAVSPDATEIAQAKIDVQNALDVITDFEAAPLTGVGIGKYGDNIINLVSNSLNDRTTQIPARTAQINNRLGSVSQAPDGLFSGSGQYYNLFKWIDLRCSKGGGSLTQYYGYNLTIGFLNVTQNTSQNKKDEYDLTFKVTKLSANANNTNTIQVEDASGFAISDNVTVLDSDSGHGVVHTSIVGISGNSVQLSSVISSVFTTATTARLLKQL